MYILCTIAIFLKKKKRGGGITNLTEELFDYKGASF
jgi:hypothetical protein